MILYLEYKWSIHKTNILDIYFICCYVYMSKHGFFTLKKKLGNITVFQKIANENWISWEEKLIIVLEI